MGINKKPNIPLNWSNDQLFYNGTYKSVMLRNKYQLILRFLHFADNSCYDAKDPNRDRMYKLCPVVNHLLKTLQEVYKPTKEVSIDEQLLLYKGL